MGSVQLDTMVGEGNKKGERQRGRKKEGVLFTATVTYYRERRGWRGKEEERDIGTAMGFWVLQYSMGDVTINRITNWEKQI
ncbi:unnamed protein product [Citrullus colocynthis]|uniref:Uncharacterized protein n=1 Tax=Citrullus colocynthis TaxID=252529 RepID=A0ABP0YC57_9ROSI